MTHAEAAEVIKGIVGMEDVARMYGYTVKNGFMECPFHGDRNASLKIYKNAGGHNGWHCFGCGRGGSVIDFVMAQEDCSFRQAVRTISDRMGLNLVSVDGAFRMDARHTAQRKLDEVRDGLDGFVDEARRQTERQLEFFTKWLQHLEEKPKEERTAGEWMRILWILNEMMWFEYVSDCLEEMKREVSEWRKRARCGPGQ